MQKNRLLIFLVMLINVQLYAQRMDSSLAYYPMHIGDKWHYSVDMIVPWYSLYVEILGDTILSNEFKYFCFSEKRIYRNSSSQLTTYWKRIDSLSGSIYHLDSLNGVEYQEDSLRTMPGDSFFGYPISYDKKSCTSMHTANILGIPTVIKSFSGLTGAPVYQLAYGFGLSYFYLDNMNNIGAEIRKLVYAKINGVEHGVPLIVPNSEVNPRKFILHQNYPNPFNPNTTISFNIPLKCSVKIKITNAIGQIVFERNYSELSEGQFSFHWNPKLASGVYYYRMDATSLLRPYSTFSETKKMLLLK